MVQNNESNRSLYVLQSMPKIWGSANPVYRRPHFSFGVPRKLVINITIFILVSFPFSNIILQSCNFYILFVNVCVQSLIPKLKIRAQWARVSFRHFGGNMNKVQFYSNRDPTGENWKTLHAAEQKRKLHVLARRGPWIPQLQSRWGLQLYQKSTIVYGDIFQWQWTTII